MLRRLWHSPTATTWGSLFARFAGIALVMPWVLARFEPGDVAAWQLFASVYTLTLLLDFGVTPSVSRYLSYALGGATLADIRAGKLSGLRADPSPPGNGTASTQELERIFAGVRWLYPRVALATALLLVTAGSWAMQRPLAGASSALQAWLSWLVVIVGSVFSLAGNAYSAGLQGMNHIAPLRRWEVATSVGQILSSLIVLALGGGLLWLVSTQQAWAMFNVLRNRWLLGRLHPALLARPARRDTEVLSALWPTTWRSGLGVLFSQGIIQASGLVYGQVARSADLATYLIALRIITTISQFSQAPFYSKLPSMARLHAEGRRDAVVEQAQRGMKLAHWVFVAGCLAALFLAEPVLRFLGSRTAFASPALWSVMSLAFLVERFGAMHLQLYTLSNHIVWHIANGVTGVLMLLLAWLGYPYLGLVALPLAMLAAYTVFYAPFAVRLSYGVFHLTPLRFESRAFLPPLALMTAGLALAWRFLPP